MMSTIETVSSSKPKYKIFDAETGEEKKGAYFVLKINASSAVEKIAVANAMRAYIQTQRELGNPLYAVHVERYLQDALRDSTKNTKKEERIDVLRFI